MQNIIIPFKPTKEQERIFMFVKKRPENLLIKAFAGTGKTSTIIEAVKLLPKEKSIMFLAFNRHIKEELTQKLPEHVRCYTTYGLGNSAIKRKYGDSIVFDEFKIDKIIKKKAKTWDLEKEFKKPDQIFEYLNLIKKLVNLCRLTLTLKSEYVPYIAEKYDIAITSPTDIKRVLKVLDTATNDRKQYDYTDMVYLPAIDNSIWMFPQDYVFIDELQDTNRCQLKIVEKILKKNKLTGKITGRIFAIGDNFQSIYGFNAADGKSFEWFEKFPNVKVLPLSTSFRCSKNVIKEAQKFVPDIKALDDAPDGIVRDGNVLTEPRSGDFVLCRTTMPLVKLFFYFLMENKKAIIKGSDIGLQLIELIGTIKSIDELKTHWNNELKEYAKSLRGSGALNPNEHTGYIVLEDKVMTLLFLSDLASDITDLKSKISTIFTDTIQGIVLSTVHKAKGLEANRVFIIRPDLLPMPAAKGWQYIQEKNLCYVAITRAKNELIYDRKWTDIED